MDLPQHPATQKDIAIALGLSQPTVSMALKDNPRIPIATRELVVAKAKSLGYQVSAPARALSLYRHSHAEHLRIASVAWLNFWSDLKLFRTFKEFAEYMEGAKETAEKLGYHLEEFKTEGKMKATRLNAILRARGIQGLLLPPHRVEPSLKEFDWSPFTIVKFGRSRNYPSCHMASSDQLYNGILAYKNARQRGYHRIGFISENLENWFFDAGYLKAQQAEEPANRLPILYVDQNHLSEMKTILKRWVQDNKPDAIITCLHGIPELFDDCGYKVPDDFAFASTSVLDGGTDTGIDQNPRQIGRVAMLSLVSLLHDNQTGIPDSPQEILVKGKWVDGSTLPTR